MNLNETDTYTRYIVNYAKYANGDKVAGKRCEVLAECLNEYDRAEVRRITETAAPENIKLNRLLLNLHKRDITRANRVMLEIARAGLSHSIIEIR